MPAGFSEKSLADPVVQHLRRDITRLRSNQTVAEALAWLRDHPPEGRIIYFYVVDEEDRLRGVVPTRRLILSPLEQPLAEVMVKSVVALPADATVLDACEFFIQHRLLAFPVVDEERRLLGAIDVELYTDEIMHLSEGRSRDDLFQLIGVQVAQAQQALPFASFRLRFPWLICNIIGGLLAAFLSGAYEHELTQVVSLALFIPVVLTLAESVSIQSVSLAIQAVHAQTPTWGLLLRKLLLEMPTGLFLGVACASLVGGVCLAWLGHGLLALCLFYSIAGSVTCTALIGLGTPYLLHLLRRDPRVAAGPVALVISDLLTLLIYFNLARVLLV
jgi:magnesium transporter